jgi:hypothetical protein
MAVLVTAKTSGFFGFELLNAFFQVLKFFTSKPTGFV